MLAAGAGDIEPPVGEGEQRSRLGHAITNAVREPHLPECLLDIGIEGCTTHDELLDVAAETGLELVHNCLVNDLLDSGDRGKKLHVPLVQDGLDGVVVNLFHHERDRDDNIRLDIRHGLEKRGRSRGLAQIIDGNAAAERVQELEHHAVDMAHGEHRDDAVLLAGGNVADSEIYRGTKGLVLKHDALRGTGST